MPEFVSARLADAAAGLLIAAALLLLARRITGGFTIPLAAAPAVAYGCVAIVLWAVALGTRSASRTTAVVPLIALAAIAGSLTMRGSGAVSLLAVWAPVVAAVVVAGRGISHSFKPAAAVRRSPVDRSPTPPPIDASTSAVTRRYVDAAGIDCFEASYRAECPAGGRIAVVHAAFHPPFAAVPKVEAVPEVEPSLDDRDPSSGVQLRTTLVLPYGARIEVRYPSADSAARVTRVRLTARGLQSSVDRNA